MISHCCQLGEHRETIPICGNTLHFSISDQKRARSQFQVHQRMCYARSGMQGGHSLDRLQEREMLRYIAAQCTAMNRGLPHLPTRLPGFTDARNPCDDQECTRGSRCHIAANGTASCICPQKCPEALTPVCGTVR